MVVLTTPRTAFSICKGLLKRQVNLGSTAVTSSLSGIGSDNPHIYTARAGLFDVDYLGHMNNAMYLSHAELARWEWTAYNGMLSAMTKKNIHFLVKGSCIRYRQEIRPIFRHFQIDSSIAGLDDKHFWIMQKFRYSSQDRIRCQILVQGVAVKGREVLNPAMFLKDIGMNSDLVDSLILPRVPNPTVEEMLERYAALEDAMRVDASHDDNQLRTM